MTGMRQPLITTGGLLLALLMLSSCASRSLRPEHPIIRKGKRLLHQGRHGSALEAFAGYVQKNPNNSAGYFYLGNTYHCMGRYQDAIRAYRNGLLRSSQPARLLFNLGQAYYYSGRYPEAARSFRRALKQEPEMAIAHLELGRTCFRQSDFQGAIRHWNSFLKQMPDDPQAPKLRRAIAYLKSRV